jgi:flagellar motor switch protein FliN
MTQQLESEVTQPIEPQESADRSSGADSSVSPAPRPTQPLDPSALARLAAVEVRTAVELGATELLVRDLAALGPGSILQLDRLVGEPADLTVNGRLFARGDVVVVDDHLGLRITELVDPQAEAPPDLSPGPAAP